MNRQMTVHRDGKAIYEIVLAKSFEGLAEQVAQLKTADRKICIVTDSNVAELYLAEVEEILKTCCRQVISFTFPAGEENKNLKTVQSIYETLIRNHFDRQDLLVALGGGVVGDLCGYAAATYLRGVSFIQIPTTLLAQVDSSIGGKTGVDFDSYKNMVGAFHMPKLVYSNVRTLLSLPTEQFTSGMGEIIKHGLIMDRAYYEWLSSHRQGIMDLDLDVCLEMIERSDQIKRKVVEEDPTEQGARALLNFGHTLGHAIEKLMDFQMLHGHCVAVGSLAAAWMSERRGAISREEALALRDLLQEFQIPVQIPALNADAVIAATKNDKKMDGNTIKFILLEEIGHAVVDRKVTEEEMKNGLMTILQ